MQGHRRGDGFGRQNGAGLRCLRCQLLAPGQRPDLCVSIVCICKQRLNTMPLEAILGGGARIAWACGVALACNVGPST